MAELKRKLRIGWFSFSCCEDSTIVFTELLNDYYTPLMELVEIRHARVFRKNNDLSDLDIAFVEGAISSERYEKELKEIRKNCKKLIAVGSCAATGMPSAQRNDFDEKRKKEINPFLKAFDFRGKVVPLHDIVQVDDTISGCPMTEAGFLKVFNRQLEEFGIHAQL